MEGQLTLFPNQNNNFTIIESEKEENSNDFLKCFKSELKSVEYLPLKELFSGFNTIKAITFSYDIGFINEIMEHFDYGEVILGANFLIQKDQKFNELMAEVCTNAYEAGQILKKYSKLTNMLTSGDIEIRTPAYVLDHRKIYLLKSDDGKTRVIKSSANMSKKAWNNDHMEHYEYDDSEMCYEEYIKDFETAWEESKAITMDVISSKKADDLVDGNALLKGVKETGRTIVLKQPESDISFDNIRYTIDHETIKEEYKKILKDVNPKAKNGLFEILPKTIEKIKYNQKRITQKKVEVNDIIESYPSLSLDLYNKEAFLNNGLMNLNPSEEEVRHDIDEIINIYNNFNQFVTSDVNRLKETHFAFMNAIFCSPFNAKVRCVAKIRDIATSSLPLFALISSETSNSGKTFMIRAALKMMTGKELDAEKACDCNKGEIKNARKGVKSIPFFVDEIDNPYLGRIKDIIKNPEACENEQNENMPMILFASNDVIKPEEAIRKRMIFFIIDGALPSTIDKIAYESKGKAIIKKLGTGFYREYLKRMMDKTKDELDFIMYTKNIPDEYYPDLMAVSSEVIISIFEDYGYPLPSYIKKLTWKDHYSSDSYADDIVAEIGEFCKTNKEACSFTKNEISIKLSNDKNGQDKIKSWEHMLPSEMKARTIPRHDCQIIIIDRKEFESKLGYKFGGFSFFRRK